MTDSYKGIRFMTDRETVQEYRPLSVFGVGKTLPENMAAFRA
jgi:hypothetical protein